MLGAGLLSVFLLSPAARPGPDATRLAATPVPYDRAALPADRSEARAAGDRWLRFSGTARTLDGKLFYREAHEVEYRGAMPLRATTRYESPDGAIIGTLRTDFEDDAFAPAYVMRGPDGRVIERVAPEAGKRVRMAYKQRADTATWPQQRLVVGQGFNAYIQYHRAVLARNVDLKVAFPIPSRGRTFAFRVRRTGSDDPDRLKVKVDIDNWLFALVAPSLEAHYAQSDGRLLYYRGVSNIENERGDNPVVEIDYTYGGRP